MNLSINEDERKECHVSNFQTMHACSVISKRCTLNWAQTMSLDCLAIQKQLADN